MTLLTRTECNIMRGFAIMGIFLHNFCHWLGPVVKENEYTFNKGNADWLLTVTANADSLLPMHWVSFFGHYGVPIFLFLSAYGLEKKYGSPQQPGHDVGIWKFVKTHYLKLFYMMILGFAAFTMVDAITPGRWHYNVVQIVAQLFMVNNLLPDPDHQIWPGPYWYFGLMLQLYIVYRLFLYRRHWGVTVAFMVVFAGLQFFFDPMGDAINSYRYNFMGGMLPFGSGILVARLMDKPIELRPWQWTLTALLLSVGQFAMSGNVVGWTLAPVVVIAACVALTKAISGIATLADSMVWMGEISAALFISHPIVRKIFIPISRHGDYWTGLLLYIVASLCVAWLFSMLMKKLPKPKA